MERRTLGVLLSALMMLLVATGCPKPPEDALSDASEAVESARDKSECAKEKFQEAKRLLEEARQLSKEKKYDEAERKAEAAEKLAKEARAEAEANWEDCQEELRGEEGTQQDDAQRDKDDTSGQQETREEQAELHTVHFGYDSADLSSEAREKLQENVRWLEQHPNRDVRLEGHTDKRGSVSYNLALGEQRAKTVKEYLMKFGIDEGRMDIVSYGEEKPVAFGDTSSAFRKNRRVEFVPE